MRTTAIQTARNTRANSTELAKAVANIAGDDPRRVVIARITSSAAIASTTNRWAYSWTEAWWDPSASPDVMADKSGGLVSTDAGLAYNLFEMNNNGTDVGPETLLANIPAGFDVLACEGHVMLFPHRGNDGVLIWLFCKPNAIDGTC